MLSACRSGRHEQACRTIGNISGGRKLTEDLLCVGPPLRQQPLCAIAADHSTPYDYHRLLYTLRVTSPLKEAGVFRLSHRWDFSGGIRIAGLGTLEGGPPEGVPPRDVDRLRSNGIDAATLVGRATAAEEVSVRLV